MMGHGPCRVTPSFFPVDEGTVECSMQASIAGTQSPSEGKKARNATFLTEALESWPGSIFLMDLRAEEVQKATLSVQVRPLTG